jgi:hypothetical protein
MIRKLAPVLAAILLLAVSSPILAQPSQCLVGPGLASTLLIPYFEVDLGNPSGVTTLISVNNGELDPALTRVVLWTDWGVPTLAFDIYLEGLDIATINVRSLFNGNVPSTGDGVDLSGFPFCDLLPPDHANPVLIAEERAQLAADHMGQIGPLAGDCAGEPVGDGIARGYITVDVVDECSGVEGFAPVFTPANTDYPYFADNGDPSGIGIIDNRLWGDVVYVNFNQNSAQGSEAIALWADAGEFSGVDVFTFYGRFSGFDGRDDRVPLANLWDQRFFNGGPFAGGANLIVYRDTGVPPETAVCGGSPSWYPLVDTSFAQDEDADNFILLGDQNFPVAAQRVNVGSFGIPYDFGLLEVSFGTAQGWIQPTLTAGGLFSAAYNGAPVRTLCDDTPP